MDDLAVGIYKSIGARSAFWRFRMARLQLLLIGLLSGGTVPAMAAPSPDETICEAEILSAEQVSGVPDHLLLAIGLVESGRPDHAGRRAAWPWTINAEGADAVFRSKAEAIAAVQTLQARGVSSIDVGCVQINLAQHPLAFSNLDQAFDPRINVKYGASFLLRLFAESGSWMQAVANYHSRTPSVGEPYRMRVLAVLPRVSGFVAHAGETSSYGVWPPPGVIYGAMPPPSLAYRALSQPSSAEAPMVTRHPRAARWEQLNISAPAMRTMHRFAASLGADGRARGFP